jgi:hypothetical protein
VSTSPTSCGTNPASPSPGPKGRKIHPRITRILKRNRIYKMEEDRQDVFIKSCTSS